MITSRRRVYKNGYLEEIGFFSILELKIEMERFERSDLIFKISFINTYNFDQINCSFPVYWHNIHTIILSN